MKIIQLVILIFLLFSCKKKKVNLLDRAVTSNRIILPEFESILDKANVDGAILVYDFEEDKFYSNDFARAERGQLPASTFKIPHSIIALETKIVENDSTVFKWDGEKRGMKLWEQDLLFKDAFNFSCVPCYQEIARKVDVERMISYLNKLNYGLIKLDKASIDTFWLKGDSRINQFQQIDFLKRLYNSELSILKRTELIMKRIMIINENEKYRISGKTGWSVSNEIDNGWFVGYVESKGRVYFFATNIEPNKNFDMKLFPMIRKEVTYKALKKMEVI